MNDRDIEWVLHQAARSIFLPPKFQDPSALVRETAARNRRRQRQITYALGAAAAAGALLTISLWRQSSMQPSEQIVENPPAGRAPLVPGEQTVIAADQHVYTSVEEMAADAAIVVRGTVEQKLTTWNLERDVLDPTTDRAGRVSPGTDYLFKVSQYVKGSGTDAIVITLPGGTYNGTHWVEEVEVGKEYLFFLKPRRGADHLTPDGRLRYGLVARPGYYEIRGGIAYPAPVRSDVRMVEVRGGEVYLVDLPGYVPAGFEPVPVDELIRGLE